jgi:hypothetical protein
MFGTERRCAKAEPGVRVFNDPTRFCFGAAHVYQREVPVAKNFTSFVFGALYFVFVGSLLSSSGPLTTGKAQSTKYQAPTLVLYTLLKLPRTFRLFRNVRFAMALNKFFLSVVLLALTASVASAYTIIMRDGRRVEIPNEFSVTNSTLTYEAGPGIQITIQLASVDIAATERFNGQPKGALLQKVSAPPAAVQPAPRRRSAGRSITNGDLEVYRRTRIESELAYEKRRRELGLPSLENQRRESTAIAERTREQLLGMRAEEQNAEEYWRSRASSLRTDLASNQAQIDFVRGRLDEIPLTYSFGAFSTTIPFGTVGTPVTSFPFQNPLTPNVFAQSIVNGARFSPNISFQTGRGTLPGIVNQGRFHGGRGHGGGRFSGFRGGTLLAVPFQSLDYSFERTELISRLNELEIQRVALKARWGELEEEARRAGAYPGWLRP